MKVMKHNVTYDSSTGKMYAELGSSGGGQSNAGAQQDTHNRYYNQVYYNLYLDE